MAILIAFVLYLAYAVSYDAWYKGQPIEVHLRDVFKESGFSVPDNVSGIRGMIGFKDFQGDFSACLTFKVRPDQIESFMQLPARGKWKNSGNFKAWDDPANWSAGNEETNIREIESPAGTFIIEEWDGEYMRRYGANVTTGQIFFLRSST